MLALQLIANGVIAGSLYGLLAISFGVIYAATRHFHIAHAAIFAIAAYLTATFWSDLGISLPAAIVVALTAAAIAGGAISSFVYGPLNRRSNNSFSLFLVALALVIIVENVFTLWLGTRGITIGPFPMLSEAVGLAGVTVTRLQVSVAVVSLAALLLMVAALKFTHLGALVRALSSNPDLLRMTGRRPELVQLAVYLIGSVLVGVAGVLTVLDVGISSGIGTRFFMVAVVCVILGGVGSILGAYLSGLMLGLLEHVLQLWIPGEWTMAVALGCFLVLITLFPMGLGNGALGRIRPFRGFGGAPTRPEGVS